MNRSARTVAATLAAAVAFGLATPAALAAAPGGTGKPSSIGGSQPGGDKTVEGPKASQKPAAGKPSQTELGPKAANQAERISRDVLRVLTRKKALMDRVAEKRLTRLDDAEAQTAVLENIAADELALADLADAVRDVVEQATSLADVRARVAEARQEQRGIRPVNYIVVTNLLLQAQPLESRIAANTEALGQTGTDPGTGPDPGTGADPVVAAQATATLEEALTANEEAAAAVAAAVEKALAVTASSTKKALQEVRVDLVTARTALGVVASFLDTFPDTEVPVVKPHPVVVDPTA